MPTALFLSLLGVGVGPLTGLPSLLPLVAQGTDRKAGRVKQYFLLGQGARVQALIRHTWLSARPPFVPAPASLSCSGLPGREDCDRPVSPSPLPLSGLVSFVPGLLAQENLRP